MTWEPNPCTLRHASISLLFTTTTPRFSSNCGRFFEHAAQTKMLDQRFYPLAPVGLILINRAVNRFVPVLSATGLSAKWQI